METMEMENGKWKMENGKWKMENEHGEGIKSRFCNMWSVGI